MKRSLTLMSCLSVLITSIYATKKIKIIKITVEPKEAVIYADSTLTGYGYAKFTRPKKKSGIMITRCECSEYKPILTKYYGEDRQDSLSPSLQQDGFFRTSAVSGIVNKFFTIGIDPVYYGTKEDRIDVDVTRKLLHQILLNHFKEIAAADPCGGYPQTPQQHKAFTLLERQIKNRTTIRDISTPKGIAFQIKIVSEVAGNNAARRGKFTEADEIPRELEPIIEKLQTRVGKVSSL